ncbi:MAG: hypothetical protein DRQ99_32165, partial [Candidatus Parabeggiatoa sp. nov. 3]
KYSSLYDKTMTTLIIREQPNNAQNEYQATVSFNKDEFPCTVKNPGTNQQVYDLEWYFKEYRDPEDEKAAWQNAIETTMTQYYNDAPKIEAVTQAETSTQNDNQSPTQENTLSMATAHSSIDLYNRLRRLPKPLFNDICFYLKEEYHYDLDFIDANGIPAESARQLVDLLKQFPQGFAHLQQLLEKRGLL